ncbi:MAG: alpha-N-arabinofuranosidase [Bacteroidaceae bacterium]|nr:alpha-N-arabinofuranosidase [Bacteroidaceae bacterium]
MRTNLKKLSVAAFMLTSSLAVSAQDATATLNTAEANTVIPKEIYGHFAEHLGACIYQGLWVGKDSDIPNIDGYRKDVFEALKELQIPVMRWPGGCFADEYHWMDGVGPQEKRPRLVNNNWGGTVEDNSFGTHEFLNLCEMLGCEPYVSTNVGGGTVEEMAKWVEYMTSNSNSTMAEMRRKNGRDKAWKVKYLGIGNESWGCGGQMLPEYYADLYRRYSIYARNYDDNKLYKVASGANGDDTNWTEVCMKKIGNLMPGISVHYYAVRDWDNHGSATQFDSKTYYADIAKALYMDELIAGHEAVMDKYDPKKKVELLVDEWGTWWDVEPGTNPGHLFQQQTMRDALVASTTFDIFHKHTARVKMANIAQVVNVLQAMILTKGKEMVLTPTYYVFQMYKPHMDATFIPATLTCSDIQVDEKQKIPSVSITASKKDGNVTVCLSNISLDKAQTVEVDLSKAASKVVSGTLLNAKNINDYNDFGKETLVKPVAFKDAKIKNGKLTVKLPAHSIVAITLN